MNELGYKIKSDLPFDIIYKIYFYIDDYCTANNFLFLCKAFTKNYMNNTAYCHKFNILYKNLFSFLILLPETFNIIDNRGDLAFFELLMCQSKNKMDKNMIRQDILFVYNLYKNFFLYYLANNSDRTIINVSNNLSNIIILQGTEFINNLVVVHFNKNKVSIRSKYKNRYETFQYILKHYNRYNLKWVQYQIQFLN